MYALTRAVALGAWLALAAGAGAEPAARAPEATRSDGLSVSLALTDLDGQAIDRIATAESFRITLRFSEPSGGGPPRDLNPVAWLRRVGAGRPACQDAARALRVTGRPSPDDVPLAGLSVVTLDDGNRLASIDPHRPASARIVSGLVALDEAPGALAVQPDLGLALFSRPSQGDVMAMPLPAGRPRVWAAGLGRPGAIVAGTGGRAWVGDDGGRALLLDAAGRVVVSHPLEPGRVRFMVGGPTLAVAGGGAVRKFDRATGTPLATYPLASDETAVAATPDALLTIAGGRLTRRFDDAPEAAGRLDLPGHVLAAAVDPAGRWALAAARDASGRHAIHVLDLARARRVYGAEAPESFDEAVIVGQAAFLTWRSRPVVTVIDLAALASGPDAAVRDVRLAEWPGNAAQAVRTGPMIVSLAPLTAVAVVRPGGRTLHTVTGGGGLSSAAMSAISLKGAPPVALALHPRSLVRNAAGDVFEGIARLPRGGTWEVAVTTGIGGTTACLPLPTDPEPEPAPAPRLAAAFEPGGSATRLAVWLEHWPADRPLPARLPLRIVALDGSSVRLAEAARPAPDGPFRADLPSAAAGSYVVSLGGGEEIRPALAVLPDPGRPR